MNPTNSHMTDGTEFIFDPVAKTAVVLRFAQTVAVPGRFDTYNEAYVACLRVVRAKYVDAYSRA
jgi:hypothetical protein